MCIYYKAFAISKSGRAVEKLCDHENFVNPISQRQTLLHWVRSKSAIHWAYWIL